MSEKTSVKEQRKPQSKSVGKKTLKVCFLCEYFYPDSAGGPGTVFSNLARHLGHLPRSGH